MDVERAKGQEEPRAYARARERARERAKNNSRLLSGLRAARLAADMTQGDVAAAIGVSQSGYWKWEACRRVPSDLQTLVAIADVLGCTVDALYGHPNPAPPSACALAENTIPQAPGADSATSLHPQRGKRCGASHPLRGGDGLPATATPSPQPSSAAAQLAAYEAAAAKATGTVDMLLLQRLAMLQLNSVCIALCTDKRPCPACHHCPVGLALRSARRWEPAGGGADAAAALRPQPSGGLGEAALPGGHKENNRPAEGALPNGRTEDNRPAEAALPGGRAAGCGLEAVFSPNAAGGAKAGKRTAEGTKGGGHVR